MVVTDRDRLGEAGDRAGRRAQRAGAPGIAKGLDRLARGHLRRVPERSGLQVGSAAELDDGDVRSDVVADDLRGVVVGGAGNDDVDRGRALDHVVVRQHLSRRGQHDPRAGRSAADVGELRVDDDHPVADRRRTAARECQARAHAKSRQSDDRDEDQAHA